MKANTPPGQNLIVKSVSLVSQFVGPGDGEPSLQNLPHQTQVNPTKNLRQGLQGSHSQGRIIEFGAIAPLPVGRWKQARRKWLRTDATQGHTAVPKWQHHVHRLDLGPFGSTFVQGPSTRRQLATHRGDVRISGLTT